MLTEPKILFGYNNINNFFTSNKKISQNKFLGKVYMRFKIVLAGIIIGWTIWCGAEDVIQIGILGGFPDYTNYGVSGLKLGIPVSGGDGAVCGWELGILSAMSRNVSGLQTSVLFNRSSWVDGVQMSLLVNQVKNDYSSTTQLSFINLGGSFQAGVINLSDDAFQVGGMNFNQNGFLPIFPIINFSVK